MVQREWVEKDFYKVLGVSSDASDDEIKRVAKKLLAENHPDRNPNNPAAEDRYKEVGEARDVLTDNAKRAEYDETRRMFASGGFGRRFGGRDHTTVIHACQKISALSERDVSLKSNLQQLKKELT